LKIRNLKFKIIKKPSTKFHKTWPIIDVYNWFKL
jgi:hypothetical protein